MTTAADTAAHHRQESWRLLDQVDAELERGELEAASQAVWEAAAHGVRAAAARRGWAHDSARDLAVAISRLIDEEAGSIDLNTNFIIAHSFNRIDRAWEMPLYEDDVHYGKEPVAELLELLERLEQ